MRGILGRKVNRHLPECGVERMHEAAPRSQVFPTVSYCRVAALSVAGSIQPWTQIYASIRETSA